MPTTWLAAFLIALSVPGPIQMRPDSLGIRTPEPPVIRDASPVAYPGAGWVPYPLGPLVAPVGPNPTFTSDSAAVVSAVYGGGETDLAHLQVFSGGGAPSPKDYSQPLYIGQSTDPVYTITCVKYGGKCSAGGIAVHIPRGAYPAGGRDHHIAIRDMPSGKDVMLWEWTSDQDRCSGCNAPVPAMTGGPVSVGWGAAISSSGDGLNAIGGTASGLSALWAVRATDLTHDSINHAVIVQINGESPDGFVYPATGWDKHFFHADPWPMMGAHFWLDVPPPYAPGCPQASVSLLTAYNKFGFYFAANGGVSLPEPNYESDIPYALNGGSSQWAPVVSAVGGRSTGTVNIELSACGIDLSTHLHVLTPPPH